MKANVLESLHMSVLLAILYPDIFAIAPWASSPEPNFTNLWRKEQEEERERGGRGM